MEISKSSLSSEAQRQMILHSSADSHQTQESDIPSKTQVDILQSERDIFYNKEYLDKIKNEVSSSLSGDFEQKRRNIDPAKFSSLENFIKFSETDEFSDITLDFIEDIFKFTTQCNLYLSDSDKKNFKDELHTLKRTIYRVKEYQIYEDSIIILFRDIRPTIYNLYKILKEINITKTDAQSECLIDVDTVTHLIYDNIITDMGGCLAGVCTRIKLLENSLLAHIESTGALIYQAKEDLFNSFAQESESQLINYGEITSFPEISIHRINAFRHSVEEEIAIKKISDTSYLDICELTKKILDEFSKDTAIVMLPINISTHLSDKFYIIFFNLIQSYNCNDILTEQGINIDKIPEGFTKGIEALVKEVNDLYPYDKNKIIVIDFVEFFYNGDEFYAKIENLETKLHAYICRSLLDENTQRILLDISHHDFPNDRELKIASIGNCYFWVTEEQNQQHNMFADIKMHTNLQLKHITSNVIEKNQLTAETYQPLIIQALRQTNDAKEIINFFLNDNIKKFLKEDKNNNFTTYLSKLITNKIEGNQKLKKQLIEELCKDYRMKNMCNILNIENTYWFTGTSILGYFLLEASKKNINISYYIENKLTIADILNLEDIDSFKKICESSKNNIIKNKIFDKKFNYLMLHNDSNAIAKLACSGFVNNLLKYNDQLLFSLAKQNNYSAIELILEINSKLEPKNKLDLNAIDSNGETLLMHVSEIGYSNLVEILINQGVDVKKESPYGQTALMLARQSDQDDCIDLLQEHSSDYKWKCVIS